MNCKRVELKNAVAIYKHDDKYREKMLSYCICDDNGEPLKYFDFVMDDDFCFSGHLFDTDIEKIEKMKSLSFTIDKDSILFQPLKEFLSNDDSFLLDDDYSIYDDKKKTMRVACEEDKIKIVFKNIKEKDENSASNRFMVFVKNIFRDGRSKIDQGQPNNKTKDRLRHLFYSFDMAFGSKNILEQYLMNPTYFNDLNKYKDTLFEMIPELKETDGFDQKNPWHIYDVWNHTLVALKNAEPDFQIRLALLLHDVGKPLSYQDDGDIRHFKGHAEKSAELAEGILKRLKLPEDEINDICYLIREHSKIIDINEVNSDNIDLIKKRLHVQYCDTKAYNPEYSGKALERLDEIKLKLEEKEKSLQNDNER